jgi:predicted alpha-1,6-mannanase (GH76 family)
MTRKVKFIRYFLPAFLITMSFSALAVTRASSNATSGKQGTQTLSANVEHAQAAADTLQQWYIEGNGLYRTTGWWNSANAITALANYSRIRHSTAYLPIFANTLHAAQTAHDGFPGFINDYYDDEGWWALAWIDVYDLTGDVHYLQTAASIFEDMQLGWDTKTCGGGVWWSKKTGGKNAIENELFLDVAASLANRAATPEQRQRYLDWAQKEWVWFHHSGMINKEHLVNDGLSKADPAHCTNNGGTTWTYNQGVILGALVELNKAAPDPKLKQMAAAIALAAIKHLTDDQGALREPAKAHIGGDAPQFKGIFSRNLMLLNSVFPNRRYQSVARANAQSIWDKDRNESNQFGFFWAGPFDLADAARQSSALDGLIAAAILDFSKHGTMPPAVSSTAR